MPISLYRLNPSHEYQIPALKETTSSKRKREDTEKDTEEDGALEINVAKEEKNKEEGNERDISNEVANEEKDQAPRYPFFNYKDHSRNPDDDELILLTPPGSVPNFLAKMHAILSSPSLSNIVRWMPHGRSWLVLNPRDFEAKVIPVYFEHSKFSSFIRLANQWGFRRITNGPDRKSYYHECFLRGLPHLCKDAKKFKGCKKPVVNSLMEPDFYKISEMFPLCESPRNDELVLHETLKDGPRARVPIRPDNLTKTAFPPPLYTNIPPSATQETENDQSQPRQSMSQHNTSAIHVPELPPIPDYDCLTESHGRYSMEISPRQHQQCYGRPFNAPAPRLPDHLRNFNAAIHDTDNQVRLRIVRRRMARQLNPYSQIIYLPTTVAEPMRLYAQQDSYLNTNQHYALVTHQAPVELSNAQHLLYNLGGPLPSCVDVNRTLLNRYQSAQYEHQNILNNTISLSRQPTPPETLSYSVPMHPRTKSDKN